MLDRERARAATAPRAELRDELAPGSDVPLSLLGSIPDLFVSSVERELDRVREATRKAFDAAAKALDGMRALEGKALRDDLVKRLDHVRKLAGEVSKRAPDVEVEAPPQTPQGAGGSPACRHRGGRGRGPASSRRS